MRRVLYAISSRLPCRIIADGGIADLEIWKPVSGYPYHVSSHGRVRSDRTGIILVQETLPKGYRHVSLRVGGKRVHKYVHRLVAEAFLGPAPSDDHEVAHRDGDSAHNHRRNLRWSTRSDNHLDKREHGTMLRGESHHQAKLTEREVREIRRRARAGELQKNLASEFKVGAMTISRAVRGINWSHLDD
ncbi:NUMOD4 motif-containing HNH endonuclease [Burkholderia gladioli]